MSIGQTFYLLTDAGDSHNIFRVGANGELTRLSPKKILERKGAFSKPSKWVNKTEVQINKYGQIISAKVPEKEFKGGFVIYIPLF